jgi:hypothetical protein
MSRASIASSYSMKPNPFMSLISVILPVPCVLKCSSISCLVAKIRRKRKSQLGPEFREPQVIQRALHRGIESPGGSDSAFGITTTIDGKGSWKTSEPAYHYEEDCLGRGGYLTLHSLCWRSSAQGADRMDNLKQAVNDGNLGGGPDRNPGWNGKQ